MGHGVRLAIDVMKAADKPMTLHEIAYATMERCKMPTNDLQAVKDVAASLRQSLKRRVGKGVVIVGGYPTRWVLETVCNA